MYATVSHKLSEAGGWVCDPCKTWFPQNMLHSIVLKFIPVLVVVQSLSRVQLFTTPWTAALQASLSFIISPSLLKLMSIESVMSSSQLILCHPLLLSLSIFPSIGSFPMSQLCPVLKEVDLLEEVEEKREREERENVRLSVLLKREKRNGLEVLIEF